MTELEDPGYNILWKYTKALSVALAYRDALTRFHSERVLGLCEEIGVRYGLPAKRLGNLKISAAFHDIGKIGIPDPILRKTAALDNSEWEVMKRHPEMGEHIMASTELEGSQQAARIIRHHHEHFDGQGYPDGLSGEQIPICSRIVAIADSYDAMAVTRSYHRARTHKEIMAILHQETGKKYDPELMRIFDEVIEASNFKASQQ